MTFSAQDWMMLGFGLATLVISVIAAIIAYSNAKAARDQAKEAKLQREQAAKNEERSEQHRMEAQKQAELSAANAQRSLEQAERALSQAERANAARVEIVAKLDEQTAEQREANRLKREEAEFSVVCEAKLAREDAEAYADLRIRNNSKARTIRVIGVALQYKEVASTYPIDAGSTPNTKIVIGPGERSLIYVKALTMAMNVPQLLGSQVSDWKLLVLCEHSDIPYVVEGQTVELIHIAWAMRHHCGAGPMTGMSVVNFKPRL